MNRDLPLSKSIVSSLFDQEDLVEFVKGPILLFISSWAHIQLKPTGMVNRNQEYVFRYGHLMPLGCCYRGL